MSNWYIIQNDVTVGPVTTDQLRSIGINPTTYVWREGMSQWLPAGSVPELHSVLYGQPGTPPPYTHAGSYQTYASPDAVPGAPAYNPYYISYSGKDKTATGILAILLGSLGIQYFYLGKIGAGFLSILLSLATCGVWNIVTLIQGILMLTMTTEEFDRKYVYTQSSFPVF